MGLVPKPYQLKLVGKPEAGPTKDSLPSCSCSHGLCCMSVCDWWR